MNKYDLSKQSFFIPITLFRALLILSKILKPIEDLTDNIKKDQGNNIIHLKLKVESLENYTQRPQDLQLSGRKQHGIHLQDVQKYRQDVLTAMQKNYQNAYNR